MENQNQGTGPMILIGAAVGLLFLFRPVRWAVCIILAILGVMFFWDTFVSEKYLGPQDYQFAIERVQPEPVRTFMEVDPVFTITGYFRNTSKVYVQNMVVQNTLYDCPRSDSQLEDCDKISTAGKLVTLEAQPGMRKGINEVIHFPNAANQNRNLVVVSQATDVVGDSDRTD